MATRRITIMAPRVGTRRSRTAITSTISRPAICTILTATTATITARSHSTEGCCDSGDGLGRRTPTTAPIKHQLVSVAEMHRHEQVPFPHIPPELVRIGPFAIRWYGVMYLVGYVVGFRIARARI